MKLIKLDQLEFERPDSEECLLLAIEHAKFTKDWMDFNQKCHQYFNSMSDSGAETIIAKLPYADIVIQQIKLQTGFLVTGQEVAILLHSDDLLVECLVMCQHHRMRLRWESTA